MLTLPWALHSLLSEPLTHLLPSVPVSPFIPPPPVSDSSHRVRGLRKTSCQSWTCHNNAAPVRGCVCLYLCECMCMQLSQSICHQEKTGNISKSYSKYKRAQIVSVCLHTVRVYCASVCLRSHRCGFSRELVPFALLIGCLALWQETRGRSQHLCDLSRREQL